MSTRESTLTSQKPVILVDWDTIHYSDDMLDWLCARQHYFSFVLLVEWPDLTDFSENNATTITNQYGIEFEAVIRNSAFKRGPEFKLNALRVLRDFSNGTPVMGIDNNNFVLDSYRAEGLIGMGKTFYAK